MIFKYYILLTTSIFLVLLPYRSWVLECMHGYSRCYAMLEAVHTLYQPSHAPKVKDYIAFPKPNGYKGLHTIVNLPGSAEPIEVQVCLCACAKKVCTGMCIRCSDY